MAKKDHETALWAEEMKIGWKAAIISRLQFETALWAEDVVEATGRSINTVRRWWRILIKEGICAINPYYNDTDSICLKEVAESRLLHMRAEANKKE